MIELKDVVKTYPTRGGRLRRVLDGLNLTLRRGESLGVMGRNGAGKSTMTRIIGGLDHVDAGMVRRSMTVSWPIGYGAAFQGTLTGADNARFIARIYGKDISSTLEYVEAFADLGAYFRMPVHTYSSGMRGRLAFGLSLAVEFDCYLVDEVTAAGDHRFEVKSQRALEERRARSALLMVSHSHETLRTYCDRFALMDGGRLHMFDDVDDLYEAYRAL